MELQSKSRSNFWIFLSVYFLLLFKAGFFFIENLNIVTAPSYLIFVILVCINQKTLIFDKKVCQVVFVLFLLTMINVLLNGTSGINSIGALIINMCSAMIFVSSVSEIEFKRTYVTVMYIVSIFSIIGWVIIEFAPSLIMKLPHLTNSAGLQSYFAGFSFFTNFKFTGANRAQGLFWEPGAFQAFVVFAMIIENYENKGRLKHLLVFSTAIVLTFSSTGMICLPIFWLIKLSTSGKKKAKPVVFLLGCIILFLLYIKYANNLTGYLRYSYFDKFQQVLNYSVGVSNQASSRMDSIVLPLRNFYKDIPFGIGKVGYAAMGEVVGHRMFTCTPINYFVYYGLIYGCICFYGFFKQLPSGIDAFQKIGLIILILLSVSSESLAGNMILLVFILYGYRRANHIDNAYDTEMIT